MTECTDAYVRHSVLDELYELVSKVNVSIDAAFKVTVTAAELKHIEAETKLPPFITMTS